MSRIGKLTRIIPNNVFFTLKTNKILQVQGLLGVLNQKLNENIKIEIKTNKLFLKRCTNSKLDRSLYGLYHILINNMIRGVSNGFTKKLELIGVGYRASCKGQDLELSLGYSHKIIMAIPNEIRIKIQSEKVKSTVIILKSFDKQLVGIVSAKIRSFRKPEPYKGKGIKYVNEYIRRKTGKTVKSA